MNKDYCDLCGGEIHEDKVFISVRNTEKRLCIYKDLHRDCFNRLFLTDCFRIFDSFKK